METNAKGLKLIKSLEGCKLTAYKLKGETNYTIGYGHSSKDIKKGQTITQAEADAFLKVDLAKFEKYVEKNTKFNLNENQFSALVSYTYNRGYKGFKQLMDNTTDISKLADNIVVYWGSNKNYKDALINRRKKERILFNTSIMTNVSRETLTAPAPVLKRGATGTKVEQLQKCLNVFGYGLVTDGVFGEKTYRALMDFQYRNGLVIDGKYGTYTYNKLRSELNGN
jgi:GH24 family phage-related lysozyme (muramidase)